MNSNIEDKIKVWLNGNFDQQTKDEINRCKKKIPIS